MMMMFVVMMMADGVLFGRFLMGVAMALSAIADVAYLTEVRPKHIILITTHIAFVQFDLKTQIDDVGWICGVCLSCEGITT